MRVCKLNRLWFVFCSPTCTHRPRTSYIFSGSFSIREKYEFSSTVLTTQYLYLMRCGACPWTQMYRTKTLILDHFYVHLRSLHLCQSSYLSSGDETENNNIPKLVPSLFHPIIPYFSNWFNKKKNRNLLINLHIKFKVNLIFFPTSFSIIPVSLVWFRSQCSVASLRHSYFIETLVELRICSSYFQWNFCHTHSVFFLLNWR